MWTVFALLNLCVLHCTVSLSPPSPIDVVFSSLNLKNVLHWSPGSGTPDDTHFTVQYAIYGDSNGKRVNWRAVRHCTTIVRNWCDLSNETWDLEQGYHAKVRAVAKKASSKWALTQRRFDPQSDTSFGPPLVSVEIQDNSAIVTLKGPMRYQPNNHTPVISMAAVYPQMTYNLSIHNRRRGQMHNFLVDSNSYTYRMMDYDTEYCFSAKTRFLTMPIQCHSSEWLCMTTPQDPVIGQLQRVIVGIVVPSLCMCALLVVCYFLCNYLTGKGQKSPYILNPPSFHPAPLSFTTTENPKIIIISIEPSSVIKPASPPVLESNLHCPDPPPRYSPQRAETPSEFQEPWDDVSVDYGLVGIAPKINVFREEEDGEKRYDRREDVNELKGKCQRCVAGNSFTGFYTSQAKPFLPLKSTVICTQTHMPVHTPIHAQTEMSTHTQAHAWSQLNSGLLTQTQVDRKSPEGFISKNPQTGLFRIPLNLQTNKEVGLGKDVEGKVKISDKKLDGDVEEGSKKERVHLLSAYASQNMMDMPPFHSEDFLPDDYGILRPATAHSVEEGDDDYCEEEEGTICINWDPETRKLVLPEMDVEFNKQRGTHGLMQGEQGSKGGREGEDEDVNAMKGMLRLENVFVRQPSEEEAGAGRGGATRREMDDFVTKWNLVISAD